MITQIKVLKQDSDLNYDVEIACMRSGVNRNNWNYQNVSQYADTFCGTPILCAYVNGQIADGHNMREEKLPNGETIYDFTGATCERIVGAISDNQEDVWTEEHDGEEWIIAKGKLWRFYNRQLVDHIAEVGTMEVSAETEVYDSYKDGDVEVFTAWRALGLTILNEKVAPAIPGANIKAMQEISEDFRRLKLAAASYHEMVEQGLFINADEEVDDDNDDIDDVNEPEEEQEDDGSDDEIIENEIDEKAANNNDEKERNIVKTFSKKALKELTPKFEGYTVLSAVENENGIHVCLMSTDGESAIYTMSSIDEAITKSKIVKHNAQVRFNFGEDCDVYVDAFELTEKFASELSAKANELENAEKKLEEATNTINDMTAKEMARRIQSAKDSAQNTLDKFNMNREEKVSEKILEAINEEIENGDFSECCDGDGNWNGDKVVSDKVLAACAKEVMEQDKVTASAKNNEYIWDSVNKAHKSEGGVAELLSEFGVQ